MLPSTALVSAFQAAMGAVTTPGSSSQGSLPVSSYSPATYLDDLSCVIIHL